MLTTYRDSFEKKYIRKPKTHQITQMIYVFKPIINN